MFRRAHTSNDTSHLSHFLLDDDVVLLLKPMYSSVEKDDVVADEEIMINFFGSAVLGGKIIGEMTTEQWDDM